MAIEIVHLNLEDWQSYKDLRLAALKNDPQAFSSTYADQVRQPEAYWRGRLQDVAEGKQSWLLFAREDLRLVGMVGAFIVSADTAGIISLYVLREARGRGISKALMSAILEETCKIPTIQKVTLAVNAHQDAAVRLYTGLGFEVVGQEESLMGDGKSYTELQMEKCIR